MIKWDRRIGCDASETNLLRSAVSKIGSVSCGDAMVLAKLKRGVRLGSSFRVVDRKLTTC
jgi:hypothetical protein